MIKDNGYQDTISVLRGRAEDVMLPDGVKADVLVSEWMGFYLFHESMLDTVLKARDRFLVPGGLMFPSSASLFICPVSMKKFHKENFDGWSNMYGFDLSSLIHPLKQKLLREPQIVTLEPSQLLATPELVSHLELQFVEPEDVRNIVGNVKFNVSKNDVLHGFACWFKVDFNGPVCHTLDTSPEMPETHWKQSVILLPDALLVSKGEEVLCNLYLQQDPGTPRRYNISLEIPEGEMSETSDVEQSDSLVEQMIEEAIMSKS